MSNKTDQLILDELCKALTYDTCGTCRYRISASKSSKLGTWKCPRIGLYTCDEAPACNAHEPDSGGGTSSSGRDEKG